MKCVFGNFLKDFDLVVGGLQVVGGAFHYFYGHVGRVFEIFCQPDGREMPPPEFLNENITVHEDLPDVAGMVAV